MTKHILLVDPSVNVASAIKRYLERELKNVQVHVAHSAQDGIHAADEQKPSLVILELAMPQHNGFAFLQEFRSYEDWQEVPVIVHSHLAKTESEMSKSWKLLNARDYFYKPQTNLRQLGQKVSEVLSEL